MTSTLTRYHHTRTLVSLSLALAVGFLDTQTASGQQTSAETRLATRSELEAAVSTLDDWAASTAYSASLRAHARTEAAGVRKRLAEGDFRVGDRILISVQGALMIDDTLTVRDGQVVTIPGLTEVSLAGILRSELSDRLTSAVTEVQRTATVLARPLVRLAVFGEVTSPGYYAVPGEATLDQLVSRAGGPESTAQPSDARLMRGADEIMNRTEVANAIARGLTIEEMDLRDGDAIVMPSRRQPWDRQMTMQILTLVLAPVMAALLVGN